MSARFAPRISLAGARAAYVGPGLDLAPHHNAAATVAIALEAPFALALGAGPPARRTIALIPPGTRHHLRAAGPMAFLYLDAAGDDHQGLRAADLERAGARFVRAGAAEVAGWDVGAIAAALDVPARTPSDPRVVDALRRLEARPQDFPRLADLATIARLSPSRFQALLRREVGLPFRRYRLWRRLALVMQALAGGRSLTEAALEAGFASSAHLSTTFRAMFGLAPSQLIARGVRIDVGPSRHGPGRAGPPPR